MNDTTISNSTVYCLLNQLFDIIYYIKDFIFLRFTVKKKLRYEDDVQKQQWKMLWTTYITLLERGCIYHRKLDISGNTDWIRWVAKQRSECREVGSLLCEPQDAKVLRPSKENLSIKLHHG